MQERATRRKPSQDRSKDTVDSILTAAKQLIGERGNDAVSMREIAAFAGVAPSSIYQYFPDKNALLQEIMSGYYERIHSAMTESIASVRSVDDLGIALDEGFERFYQLFLREPVLATLWAGVQANTVLRELDEQDSVRNARYLSNALVKLVPGIKSKEAFNAFVLLMDMAGLTVRLALARGNRQGRILMEEYKLIVKLRIERLIEAP